MIFRREWGTNDLALKEREAKLFIAFFYDEALKNFMKLSFLKKHLSNHSSKGRSY